MLAHFALLSAHSSPLHDPDLLVVQPSDEFWIGSSDGGPPLLHESVRRRLLELGEGDVEEALRKAVVFVGVNAEEDDGGVSFDSGMIEPIVLWNELPAPPESDSQAPPWLGEGIGDLIRPPADNDVLVRIRVRRTQLDVVPTHHDALARATVARDHVAAAMGDWQDRWRQKGDSAVALLTALVESDGGRVVESSTFIGEVVAEISVHSLAVLANDRRLAAIELERPELIRDDNAAGYWLNVYGLGIDGIEVESLLQTKQFYDAGFEGQGVMLGMAEGGNGAGGDYVRRAHPGFDDSLGFDRFENRKWNTFYWTNPNPSIGKDHSTAVASVILGDLTKGQDAGISSSWEQRRRSGVARMARGLGMSTASRSRIESQMTNPSRDVLALNFAFSGSSDPLCEGRDSWSRTVNDIFEAGVLVTKSAGNTYHQSTTNCTVGSPGSAIGAFTVGAYQAKQDGTGTIIDYETSRGGTAAEGRGRAIVDMVAPTSFIFPYTHRTDCGWIYGSSWGNCSLSNPGTLGNTSGSVPMVTGASAVFDSWYEGVYGAQSSQMLYTNLLLQGDRRQEGGGAQTAGYDGLWGAGRLRLRRYDGVGMDGPLRWTAGSTCVSHGQIKIIPVTTSNITSDVDVLKAVTFTYDSRHDDPGSPNSDRVELRVSREIGPGVWLSTAVDNSTDNKKRVFLYDPSPGRYAIVLYGQNVGSDIEGCGTNSTRVWYSYMHEDSDREPWENLATVRPEDEDID